MIRAIHLIAASMFLGFSSVYADMELIDVSTSGEPGNRFTRAPTESVSQDGRFIAFQSSSTNLIASDTNDLPDIFIRDRQTGTTKRVSVSSSGEQAALGSNALTTRPHGSFNPSISENGRFIAFESDAANLVPNDNNASRSDIFVHDQQTGVTELVSFLPNGEQRSWGSFSPYISADGRFVNYSSFDDMYVYDRVTKVTERILRRARALFYSISADGRFIAFSSDVDDLSPIIDNYQNQAYIYDRQTGEVEMISLSVNGEAANNHVSNTRISANGRFVSYTTGASNLVANDTNHGSISNPYSGEDVFVYDRVTKLTELVSISSTGEQGNYTGSLTLRTSISADGRYVTFTNSSSNLVPDTTTFGNRIYVHDRQSGITELVTRRENGTPFIAEIHAIPAISADGSYIVFQSADIAHLLPGTTISWPYRVGSDNPLFETKSDALTVEKRINNETRGTPEDAAQLSTGTLYRQSYTVSNDSADRLYQVRVFENGNLVCNFYVLEPGQSRLRCDTFQTVMDGEQHVQVTVTAKVSGTGEAITSSADAYYTGLSNVNSELVVTHRINNINADMPDQAPTLGSPSASVLFKVENTGDIELYQVKTYHDPVSPVNSGWELQCVLGPMKPGQVRYCKKDLTLTDSGLNQAMGRVQGRNAIRSATDVVNASNPTYFIVP